MKLLPLYSLIADNKANSKALEVGSSGRLQRSAEHVGSRGRLQRSASEVGTKGREKREALCMIPNHEDWSTFVYPTYEYQSCEDFGTKNFCTSDGEVGAGWPDASESWTTGYYHSQDYHAGHCPQCGAVDCSEPAPAEEVEVVSPCPSTECWTYDEGTHTCTMSGSCATLSCDSTQFDITFSSELFNLDTQSPGTFAGGLAPTWDGSTWSLTTPLGDSGMTYIIDPEDGITFSLPLTMVGNEMKTRSDDTIQDNVIVLGSQSVVTTPLGASIVFTCNYDTTVELASESYTVAGASVVDTLTGTGSLSAGFAMSLNNGEGAAFLMGDNMQVGITWAVTTLSTLTYRITQCDVQHGSTVITIVKDQCYAATLGVVPDANDQGFAYQVFKGVGETDENQIITCTVTICESGQCVYPTSNIECPYVGDDDHYDFEINPVNQDMNAP